MLEIYFLNGTLMTLEQSANLFSSPTTDLTLVNL